MRSRAARARTFFDRMLGRHPPFSEWRRGKDGDSGVCNIEDRLLQRRSPGTESGSNVQVQYVMNSRQLTCSWSCQHSRTYLLEWGTSCTGSLFLYGSSSRLLSRCGSVSLGTRRTICKIFATYSPQSPTVDKRDPPWQVVSCSKFHEPELWQCRKGLSPICGSDPVEQYAWGNSFVRFACQPGYN